jgi:dihydrofolate synthase / folylpolyglutamate synthase
MSDRSFLESLEVVGIKLGLDQIRSLTDQLGRPQDSFQSILVAGTNGKGSVTAMIERGLRAAGYRTGRYTSPHLIDLEERFVVDGRPVSPVDLDGVLDRVRAASARLPAPPTYFEATTAAAFEIFRNAPVDVAVLEVGLGGRLDATNVVTPAAVAITSIDFDHQAYLGNTLDAIAREKAGVIKPGCLVVLAANPAIVRTVVGETCQQQRAPLTYAPDDVGVETRLNDGQIEIDLTTPRQEYGAVRLGLRGRHQVDNAIASVRLLEELSVIGLFSVPADAIRTALQDVTWPARLELVRFHDHEVLIDGAHNPAGARALTAYLREAYGRRLPMVVGIMRDKKIDELLLALAPAASHFVFTAPGTGRAATPEELLSTAGHVAPQVPAITRARPSEALTHAMSLGAPVVVAGSLYLAGEIRPRIS